MRCDTKLATSEIDHVMFKSHHTSLSIRISAMSTDMDSIGSWISTPTFLQDLCNQLRIEDFRCGVAFSSESLLIEVSERSHSVIDLPFKDSFLLT
jgi:hypothetical protein